MPLQSISLLPALALLGAIGTIVQPAPAQAKTDMIEVGQALPRADLLRPGVHRYVRYMISGDSRGLMDLWTRTLSYEMKDGRRIMRIRQRWDAADKSYVALFDQTFEPGTMRPLAQIETVTRDGVTKSLSVVFKDGRVDSVGDGAAGAAKPLHECFAMPFFNFHPDMEFLQALPLGKNYVASIPFYDVRQEPPARYTYTVSGEATVPSADGSPIKCWIVLFQPDPKGPVIHFWFAERDQTLVREETDIPGKGRLVKTLLNAEAEDLPPSA